MTLSEKQTQSSFYSAREYLIPGLFFTFFSIRIGILPYLLQLFSAFWIFRGLGKLQNHNKNLREAYALSAGLLFWQIVLLGLMVSPVAQTPFFSASPIPALAVTSLRMALLLLIRRGLKEMCSSYEITSERDPFLWLSVWLASITALGLLFPEISSSFLMGASMVIWFIVLMVSCFRLTEEMLALMPIFPEPELSPGEKRLTKLYFPACFLLAGTCVFWNHLSLDMTEKAPIFQEAQAVSQKLSSLGIPAEILADLSQTDLLRIKDASAVHIDSQKIYFSNQLYSYGQEPPEEALYATAVYVRLSHDRAAVIEHFHINGFSPLWQDGFALFPDPIPNEENSRISGQLLFSKGNTDYTAPITRLQKGLRTSASLFGPSSSYCISGAFSFPFGSIHQRGYILYETQLPDLQSVYLMSFNYYHSGHPFHIPYRRMDQALMKGASGGIGTRQMQHYSTCWTEDFTISPAETDAVLSPAPPEV